MIWIDCETLAAKNASETWLSIDFQAWNDLQLVGDPGLDWRILAAMLVNGFGVSPVLCFVAFLWHDFGVFLSTDSGFRLSFYNF